MRTTLEWIVGFTLAMYTDPRMWGLLAYAAVVQILALRLADVTSAPRVFAVLAALGVVLGTVRWLEQYLNLRINRFLDSEVVE
jgi:hypothetical protein